MSVNDQDDDLKGYFVVKFEKFLQLMEEVEHKYQILADMIHEKVVSTATEYWDETPIKDLMKFYVDIAELRNFLEDKINNASEEEIKLSTKYNIKDVLMNTEELAAMNVLLVSTEELEARMEVEHKISISTH